MGIVFGGPARVLGMLLPAVLICTAHAPPPQPTLEIRQIDALDMQGMLIYAMRGALGTSGEFVLLCVQHALPSRPRAFGYRGEPLLP